MEFLKNCPESVTALADLIEYRKGMVISMSLSRNEHFQLLLMAVSEGEEITSEEYPGDTLYYCIDGSLPIQKENQTFLLKAGDCLSIEAHTPHAIGGKGAFKVLQISCSQK